MLGSNQPKVGYEPTSFTKNLRELRKTLESNQIPEGTSRLAGGPYRHQGLSSLFNLIDPPLINVQFHFRHVPINFNFFSVFM